MFVIVVNSIVAAGLAAFISWPFGEWFAPAAAVLAAAASLALWIRHGTHTYAVNTDPRWVRFPTPRSDAGAGPLS
jgi:F0F1-type ATP synthase membrane subunit a